MSQDARSRPPLYSQIDVTAAPPAAPPRPYEVEQIRLLRGILAAQDRQNELMEELVNQLHSAQRQKASELGQWKAANPRLAQSCRVAAEALGRAQTEFLASMTDDINDNFDDLLEGDFRLSEFVDRYGPRFAHLNGLVQVLAQLSANAGPANTQNSP